MRRETELELLRRFFKQREARTTDMAEAPMRNAAAVYTDPDRARAEWESLFRRGPLVVALSGDLPGLGEYMTTDAAGVPLLIVRSEDGQVRCFANICRHRSSPVAEGRGTPGRVFTCPYHSWTYDLEGKLLGQPVSRGGFDSLDRDSLGLLPIAVEERYGVIMVRLSGDTPLDMEQHLAGMGDELAELDLKNVRFFAEQTDTWAMNWKQAVDTFTESYHVFALHRRTIAKDFLSAPGVGIAFGSHSLAAAMRTSVSELLDKDESEWHVREHGSVIYRVFPNVVFNLPMDGHVELWQIYPDEGSPDRTRVSMRFYTPGEVTSEKAQRFWQGNFDITVKVVFEEDFDQQVAIHRNLRSGVVPDLIYGANEPGLIQFHRSIEAALRA
ncbi:MAG: aromatic ring-hydroxylating oxygenase subunit alpha [Actinomycetota bacterium]